VIPLLGGVLVAAAVMATSPLATAGPLCWRGKPLPDCETFVLTELGVYARLDDDATNAADNPLYFTLDLGLMKNIAPVAAVGLTAYGSAGDSHARVGARLRYRRWLSRDTSVDLAPGVIVYGSEDGGYTHQAPGFVLGTSLNWRDWVALGLEVEHSRYRIVGYTPGPFAAPERVSDTTWRLGGKLGSAPGVVGTAAIVGFFVYLVTSIEN
jgi:opacity protein-like surface antigen